MPTRHLPSSSSLLVLLGSLVTGCRGAPSGAPAAAPPADSARGAETGSVRGLEGEPTGAGGAPGASSPQGCGTDSPMLKYVGQSRRRVRPDPLRVRARLELLQRRLRLRLHEAVTAAERAEASARGARDKNTSPWAACGI